MKPTDPVNAENWASSNGFGERISIGQVGDETQLHSSEGKAGLYLLEFVNGDHYIGEAVDVPRRLKQHVAAWPDPIDSFRYRRAGPDKKALRSLERTLIHGAARSGLVLRNSVGTSTTVGPGKLDVVVPIELQEQWILHPRKVNADEQVELVAMRDGQYARIAPRFAQFQELDDSGDLIDLLARYVNRCLPFPRETEYHFWSVSCKPSTNKGTAPRMFCLNIGMMETFVVFHLAGEPTTTRGFIVVSEDDLPSGIRGRVGFKRRHPRVNWERSEYGDAGPLQVRLVAQDLGAMAQLLFDEDVVRAAGRLAMRVMNKRGSMYKKNHCPQLADAVLGGHRSAGHADEFDAVS